jgi:hypothetical protein
MLFRNSFFEHVNTYACRLRAERLNFLDTLGNPILAKWYCSIYDAETTLDWTYEHASSTSDVTYATLPECERIAALRLCIWIYGSINHILKGELLAKAEE